MRTDRISRPSWLSALALVAAAAGLAAGPSRPGGVVTLDGAALDPLAGEGGPTVFVFARTDCPISNRYAPELRRLHERFARQGARFWRVYPDGDETVEEIRRHGEEFAFGFAALRDPGHLLVRLTGAKVTPEVAVFTRGADGPRMVYRGRIDDRATDFGRTRPTPTRRDLEEVLDALAVGRPVPSHATRAVGCFIPDRE
ncbi:MAG TPA: redoxin domain-containing protein [Vicinamibacteria bacterium]|nr:redoxin domain-containing protein [Vicinamibacteria bacterium]